MKRKSSTLQEKEERVSQLLFNKSQKLVDSLNPKLDDEQELNLKPAWVDEDDENFSAKTSANIKSTTLYNEKLKQKYETLMGTPSWAKLNNKSKEEDDTDDEILRTVGHLHKKKSNALPKDYLDIKPLPKLAASGNCKPGVVSCVEFHPTISAAVVAGHTGVVSLFSVGGDENTQLHRFRLKQWKINSLQFTPDGSEAMITSSSNHAFCVYNLVKAEHKLFQLAQVVKHPKFLKISSDGKFIATADGYYEVYLLSTSSKELLRTLKHNSKVVSVIFSHDCTQLYCYSEQGEITIWDLSTYRPLKKFQDQGCVTGSCVTTSPCGKLLAAGSGEGIVNIYQTENLTVTDPTPLKVISNLSTRISNLKFNSTTEILSVTSGYCPNAVKLVHIPSYHIYSNFPNPKFDLHRVNIVNFSPNSGYMALSNNMGSVYLYRLKYYKNY
ncbi:unnamed protein product [Chrysodeixis includens]|uniref:U3 small nucleolar RNA-associated protein 18 homolog n=1 Tax=Chrysodeixis includens TaxID=689277 RepID=A0A9P0G0I1_CHRIL|nr:unnamed protein product [Chrysodeixis includens]